MLSTAETIMRLLEHDNINNIMIKNDARYPIADYILTEHGFVKSRDLLPNGCWLYKRKKSMRADTKPAPKNKTHVNHRK